MSGVRVVFLRHAQGTHNAAAAAVGARAYFDPVNRDAALTAEGVRQAWAVREVGRLGRAEDYTAIFCSPLRRCRQTLLEAVPGADRFPVRLDDRLMEPQGAAICNRRAELEEIRAPTIWSLEGVGRVNPYDLLSEGGTVGEAGHGGFERRVREFTEAVLCRQAAGGRVLVVAHHDWIRAWFRLYEPERGGISIGNCEWVTTDVRVA
jgi:broad specificity phosphatase PhoE